MESKNTGDCSHNHHQNNFQPEIVNSIHEKIIYSIENFLKELDRKLTLKL